MRRAMLIAAICFAPNVAAAQETPGKLSKQARELLAMTPNDFAKSAEYKDDSLEVVATITTRHGFKEKHGLLRVVWNDNFLRAFIHKETGKTTFQVYQQISYVGRDWKHFRSVNYETLNGPKSAELLNIGTDVDCSSSRLLGGCTYTEIVGFDVDEQLLQEIARRYEPNKVAAWRFRFKARAGDDFTEGMVAAEAAGLLQAVEKYRAMRARTVVPASAEGGQSPP